MGRTANLHQIARHHSIVGLLCFYLASACADESSVVPKSSSSQEDSMVETTSETVEESHSSSTDTSSDNTWVQDCENDIRFADSKVEAWVRYRANVPTGKFTRENLAKMFDIVASGAKTLEGLQCLPWITELQADLGAISDLSPLTNLRDLRRIDLSYNNIQDISPISRGGVDSETVWSFDLSGNPIRNLEDFELPNLPDPEPYCSEFILQNHSGSTADRNTALSYCAQGWAVAWSNAAPGVGHVQCDPGNCPPPLIVAPSSPNGARRIAN